MSDPSNKSGDERAPFIIAGGILMIALCTVSVVLFHWCARAEAPTDRPPASSSATP